jgi:hypothetical protein
VPAGLAASSDGHREVAGQIDSALDADAPAVAAMPASVLLHPCRVFVEHAKKFAALGKPFDL